MSRPTISAEALRLQKAATSKLVRLAEQRRENPGHADPRLMTEASRLITSAHRLERRGTA